MTLRIFPNALSAEPFEVHETGTHACLAEWLAANAPDYDPSVPVDWRIEVDGKPADLSTAFGPGSDVRVTLLPKGTDPFSITAALFKGAQAAFRAFMPKIPGTPNAPAQGASLSSSNVRGNRVKLGDVIREVGGHMRVYPDFLVPQRSYFVNGTEQWVESLFCIGVGQFQFAAGGVKVGETSLLALDTAASFTIYQPGQSMVGDSRADWWHSAEEVGASSTGTAGLELTVSTAVTPNVTAGSLQFNGFTITIPTGQGTFPTDWAIGQNLRIVAPYSFTVTDGGGTNRDVVTGPLAMVAAAVGDQIEIAGSINAGNYTVVTFNTGTGMTLDFEWGAPANTLTTGTGAAAIGPKGLLYKITAVDTVNRSYIQVVRLTTAGTTDSGWPGFNALTTSAATISLPPDSLQGGYRGPFPAVPQNEVCSAFEIDVFYPNGLCGIGREGQIYPLNGYYDVEWRDMAVGGAWNVVHISHRGTSRDQQGYTDRINLPYAMRPEVRVKKVFVNQGGNSTSEYQDAAQWYNLRGRIDRVPYVYEGVTCLAVTLRSSDRIANQSESLISAEVTRILPQRRGGTWTAPTPTRDITAFAAYVAKALGYTDAQLNLAEFDALQNLWTARGDTYDGAVTSATTAKKLLNDIFGAGMGEYTMDGGKIRPVREGLQIYPKTAYSPQSNKSGLKQNVSFPGPDDYDAVEVTYTSSKTWQEETVTYMLPGDAGNFVQKISAPGVTDRTRAWRIGARARRIGAYRRKSFEWQNELDGRVSKYLDYVAVSDDVPGYGQSALMRAAVFAGGMTTITVSEAFDWSGIGNVVAFTQLDGSLTQAVVPTRTGDKTFTIPGALPFTPVLDGSAEPPHVLFGPLATWVYPVLVTAVKPNGMASTTMQAVGYDARVYADDDNSPP